LLTCAHVQGLMLADVAVVVVSARPGEYQNGMQGWHPLPIC
jgi:translation elongation factor EF-1alpha